jgi:hypothetical protein
LCHVANLTFLRRAAGFVFGGGNRLSLSELVSRRLAVLLPLLFVAAYNQVRIPEKGKVVAGKPTRAFAAYP